MTGNALVECPSCRRQVAPDLLRMVERLPQPPPPPREPVTETRCHFCVLDRPFSVTVYLPPEEVVP